MVQTSIINYVSPITNVGAAKYALLFGSRYAQKDICHAAWRLYRRGLFEVLLISGGRTGGIDEPEADELFRLITNMGMPSAAILLEREALNTGENVEYAKEMLPRGTNAIFLIGKIFAKRRYVMTVKKRWPAIRSVFCVGHNYFPVARRDWSFDDELKDRVLRERRKMADYVEKGMIAEIDVKGRHFVL